MFSLQLSTTHRKMTECDDSIDGFTGKYIKCTNTTIDINIQTKN